MASDVYKRQGMPYRLVTDSPYFYLSLTSMIIGTDVYKRQAHVQCLPDVRPDTDTKFRPLHGALSGYEQPFEWHHGLFAYLGVSR